MPDARILTPGRVLLLLALGAALAVALFMTLGARGPWSFVLPFRGTKVAVMLLVAYAIGVSTVLFQTVTNNRILTPGIMGFDWLYMLIQTWTVFVFGSAAVAAFDPRLRFAGEVAVMVAFSVLLFRALFSSGRRSLHQLVLAGVVFGVFFRSLSGFLQRVIDPSEFAILQDRLFASFNRMDTGLLAAAAVAVAGASLVAWRVGHTFDVLALGRERAINLGVDHRRAVSLILVLVAVLVSVSTALVGPVTFFGLMVASLAHLLTGSSRHRVLLPAAVLLGVIGLVGGQMILERVFAFDGNLRVVIEFLGGILFIILLLRGSAR
ncbi:iron chelate uptake ABC transporter family permease subunit [Azospirillum sp. SYSU D00513]|uniref:iron chelate uptake ABC transporter family permease subunit n=1 Tax=Azospirillum sp. SYSU D00513 TaxID=2812561 RepID=UPI001FFFFDB5|nr:iron chelate uptake ABC transporter family permease subunit [Azospirillum sp. SYSU D00513]